MKQYQKVAIIPARYASSRLPAKPLADIGGLPMVMHVYNRAMAIEGIDLVVVATDDNRIADAVGKYGGKVSMTNRSHQSGTDRIFEVARGYGLSDDAIVINIQGDQPLLEPTPVKRMLELLENDNALGIATPACPMTIEEARNPNRVKVVLDRNGRALYFSRSPIPYVRDGLDAVAEATDNIYLRHIGLYAYRMRTLSQFVACPPGLLEGLEKLEQLRALENSMSIGVCVVETAPVEVDTPEDLEYVRLLASNASAS